MIILRLRSRSLRSLPCVSRSDIFVSHNQCKSPVARPRLQPRSHVPVSSLPSGSSAVLSVLASYHMAVRHRSLIGDQLQFTQALISCHLSPTITLIINLNTCLITLMSPDVTSLATLRSASLILTPLLTNKVCLTEFETLIIIPRARW